MKIFTSTLYSYYPYLTFKLRNTPADKATIRDYVRFTDWGFGYTWIDESKAHEL